MKLSKRLQAIYDMVNSPCILADIGCDHALLPIALVQDGKCPKAYACDIHEGPLQRAREAVLRYGLQAQVGLILCDGLAKVPKDADVIVIAGMGCDTMLSILMEGMEKARGAKQLLLQPNNHVEELRRFLHAHDFTIDQERMVKERHFYPILSVSQGHQPRTEQQLRFGSYAQTDVVYQQYLRYLEEKQQKILQNLPSGHVQRANAASRLQQIQAQRNKK